MRYGQTSIVTFVSRVIMAFSGFFGTVVLTRVLGADQYGQYVVVLSVLAWTVIFGNLGISSAVKKRVSEQDGRDYLIPGLLVQLGLYAIVSSALWVFRSHLNEYIGFEATTIVILLLAARLVIGFLRSLLDGQHLVHISSLLHPTEMFSRTVAQVALILAGFGLIGAFAGYVVGTIVAILTGAYFARLRVSTPSYEDFRRLRTYAQFSWFQSLKGRTFASMDTIVLAAFVASGVVGVYQAAWNLASLFATFSASISQTLFPEMSRIASETDDPSEVADLLKESLAYSGLFTIPGLVGSVILGDIVLEVYGQQFSDGYQVLLILTFARLVHGYQTQLLNTIDALDHPNLTFRTNLAFVGVNILLNVVLISEYGWYGAAVATTVSAVVGLLLGYHYTSRLLNFGIPIREIGNQIIAAAVMALPVVTGRVAFADSLPVAVVFAGVGAATYFGCLLILSQQFRTTVQENLPQSIPVVSRL